MTTSSVVHTLRTRNLEGVYNFVVDHDGDFELTFKEGGLLKFYDIKIYKADECEQDNAVRVNGSDSAYEWLFTDQDATDATKRLTYNLHKRGLGEPIELLLVDNVRGNLSLTKDNFTHVGSDADHPDYYLSFYTDVKKGDFGSFRTVVGCETQDHKYVTDYASRNMAVGYRETQEYPYTWDFTDLYLYAAEAISTDLWNSADLSDKNENKGWETYSTGWALRNCPDNKWGIYFATGGQLYAGNTMFPESAGLGFKRSTNDAEKMHDVNKSVRVLIGGLELNNANSEEFHKIVIPQVDKDAVIYVRATPNTSSTTFAKALCSLDGTNGRDFDKQFKVGGDVIYIIKNNKKDGETNIADKRDVELWLNSVTVKKIGVSIDSKTVNKLGWATESRERVIDPELTEFFSGNQFHSYIVTETNTASKEVTIEEVDPKKYVMPISQGDDNNAYILRNMTEKDGSKLVKIFEDKFNLFVPDMHDYLEGNNNTKKSVVDMSRSKMKAILEPGTVSGATDEDYTNYVLTYNVAKANETNTGIIEDTGKELLEVGFYRVQ